MMGYVHITILTSMERIMTACLGPIFRAVEFTDPGIQC